MLCKLLCRYLHGRRPDRGRLRTSCARPSLRSPAGRRNPGGFEAILRTPPYVKCQNFLDILAGLWIKITNFVL